MYIIVLISTHSRVTQLYTHTYIYVCVLFHILFHYGLSQDIEYSSMCNTVGTSCLSILYMSLHLLIPSSQFFPSLPPPLGNHKRLSAFV